MWCICFGVRRLEVPWLPKRARLGSTLLASWVVRMLRFKRRHLDWFRCHHLHLRMRQPPKRESCFPLVLLVIPLNSLDPAVTHYELRRSSGVPPRTPRRQLWSSNVPAIWQRRGSGAQLVWNGRLDEMAVRSQLSQCQIRMEKLSVSSPRLVVHLCLVVSVFFPWVQSVYTNDSCMIFIHVSLQPRMCCTFALLHI